MARAVFAREELYPSSKWPGNSSIAFRESRGANDYDFAFCEVQVSANFNLTCPGEFELRIYRGERRHGSSDEWTRSVESRSVYSAEPTYCFEEKIPIKARDVDYTVFAIELVRRGCDGNAGDGSTGLGSFHADFFLGKDHLGRSAGSLLIDSEDLAAAVYTPAGLVPALADFTERIDDGSGVLRQVRAPLALADIVTTSAAGYEIRFYHNDQVGVQDPVTKLYLVNGAPFVTHRIENPDGTSPSATRRLRYSQVRGTTTKIQDYSFDPVAKQWILVEGAGERTETRTVAIGGSTTTTDIQVADRDGKLVAHKIRTENAYAWGKETTREVEYTDSTHTRTTDSVFYTATTDGGAYGRLKQRVSPSGYWEKYYYDAQGRLAKTVSQYRDAPLASLEPASRVVTHAYDTVPDADGDTLPEQRRTTTETILGSEVRRSYRIEWSKAELPTAPETATIVRVSEVRCLAPGAAWNGTANLVTEIRRYADGSYAGRTVSEFAPPGLLTTYAYSVEAGSLSTTVCTGEADALRTAVVAGIRTVTVNNAAGHQRTRDTFDITSGRLLTSETTTGTDAFGRPTRIDYADGTFFARTYTCCGLESETDREGNQTTYHYDALGRLESTTRAGITTVTPNDPEGRVLSTTRRGSGSSEIVQAEHIYDLAGRLTSSTDALGRVTTTAETTDASGHRVVTTTYQGGGTRIETYYQDGSLLSVTGTAVAPVKYEYGVDADGAFTKEIRLGADTGSGPAETEWTKAYTDFAGRPAKTVTPTSTSTSSFNAKGQLVRTVDPDGVQTLFAYDSLGRRTTTAIDLDRDGTIDFDGTDRITRTTTEYLAAHGTTVERSTTEVWAADNSATASTVATVDRAVDGTRTWQTTFGLTAETLVALPGTPDGTRTETATAPDGTSTVRAFAAGRLLSETRRAADGSALATVRYGYDSFGRLAEVRRYADSATAASDAAGTDLPTVFTLAATAPGVLATVTTYFDDDQVHTVTTPDPDPAQTGYGYDPQTTTYTYDSAGRLWKTLQPDQPETVREYYATGQLRKTSGSRTYPQEYTYDPQGRLRTLTTWQNFANASGAATTTWDYDPARGWLTGKRYADASGPTYTYHPSGRLETRTWARTVAGQPLVTTYGFNAAGDLASIDYSDSTPDAAFTYDRLGRRATTTDAAGLLSTTYEGLTPAVDDETYAATSPLLPGLAVTRARDSLLRPSSLSVASSASVPSVSHSYNPQTGHLESITAGELTHTYGYQPESSLIATLTQLRTGGTTVTTTKGYDRLGRLSSTSTSNLNSPSVSAAYHYNSANQPTRVTREDATYWRYEYDSLGQVTGAQKHQPDTTAALAPVFGYTFDDIGNRLTSESGLPETPNPKVETYTPNLLNQYEQRTVPPLLQVLGSAAPAAVVTVNFQPTRRQGPLWAAELGVDNTAAPVYQAARVIGVLPEQGPDGADLLAEETRHTLVPQNPERFTYDADGNLTQDGRWAYTWDAENRLVAMEARADIAAALPSLPLQRLEFTYDSAGRRLRKQVYGWNLEIGNWQLVTDHRFLWDGWNLLSEFSVPSTSTSNFNLVRSYVWGLDLSGTAQGAGGVGGLLSVSTASTQSTPSTTSFPSYDGNGNILALIDATTGERAAEYEYGPFGEPLRATGPAAAANPFRFSTKYTDPETDLLYYGFRYYNPSTGRWLSRDPIEEQGGINLYCFVGNAPAGRWDYLGLVSKSRCAQLMEKYKNILPREGEQRFEGENAFRDANLNGLLGLAAMDSHSEYQSSMIEWTYWVTPSPDGSYVRKSLFTSGLYDKVAAMDAPYYRTDVLPLIAGNKFSPNVSNGHNHPRWRYVNGQIHDSTPSAELFSGRYGDTDIADSLGTPFFLLAPSGRVRAYYPTEKDKDYSIDYLEKLGKEYEKDFPDLVECIRCNGLIK